MSIRPIPSAQPITCTLCGHRFDAARHVACAACPLQSGCQLVCCPVCGFEQVNPERSSLVGLFRKLKTALQPGTHTVQ